MHIRKKTTQGWGKEPLEKSRNCGAHGRAPKQNNFAFPPARVEKPTNMNYQEESSDGYCISNLAKLAYNKSCS